MKHENNEYANIENNAQPGQERSSECFDKYVPSAVKESFMGWQTYFDHPVRYRNNTIIRQIYRHIRIRTELLAEETETSNKERQIHKCTLRGAGWMIELYNIYPCKTL